RVPGRVWLYPLLLISLGLGGPARAGSLSPWGLSLAALGLLAPLAGPTSYTITDLGTLGGSFSVPRAINSRGQVAGSSLIAGDATVQACLVAGGAGTDLGTLGGKVSNGNALNNVGHVVGTAFLTDGSTTHAVLWSGGTMTDMGTLGGTNSTAWGV